MGRVRVRHSCRTTSTDRPVGRHRHTARHRQIRARTCHPRSHGSGQGRCWRCSGMTILITGATGRVGSRLAARLRGGPDEVRILVRDRAKAEPLIAQGAQAVVGNVTDPSVIEEAVKGVDSIVHLVTIFRSLPGQDIDEVNVAATARLARTALRAGVSRFVYCSTNQVYGPGRGRPAVETDE